MFSKMIQRDFLSVEPLLRRMPNGELLCVCTCGGTAEPAPENRTYFWHSADEGRTWSPRTLLFDEGETATYCTEVFVFGNRVLAYLCHHTGKFTDWITIVYESTDSGHTWKKLGPCPHVAKYTFIRSGIITKDGTILMPYQHYPVSDEENARLKAEGKYGWHANISHVESGVLASRDMITFEKRGVAVTDMMTAAVRWQWTEPTIVELFDRRIVMLLRYNGTGYLWRSESSDGGSTWSAPRKTDIPNPDNKPQLVRIDEERIALFNTPNPVSNFNNRYPLEIWISRDDMHSWEKKIRVSEFHGLYSYPSVVVSEDRTRVGIAVDFNRHDVYYLECGI